MKNCYTLLVCIALLGSILNTYALPVSDEDFGNVFNLRTKRAADDCQMLKHDDSNCTASSDILTSNDCQMLHDESNCTASGDILTSNDNIKMLISFPTTFHDHCDGSDGCFFDISNLTALCENEGPRASCLNELSVERNCGGEANLPYGYVEQLCSAEGLLLASDAMTSPCFAEPWQKQPKILSKNIFCIEIGDSDDFIRSCSHRDMFSQCMTETVRGECGAAFAELSRLFLDSYMQSYNYAVGGAQC